VKGIARPSVMGATITSSRLTRRSEPAFPKNYGKPPSR
jgi:hypothetical protein